tara:strand:+ start:950 stop:2506 length:1557 start_codon:yes stop_codon:yes gene_type:complete
MDNTKKKLLFILLALYFLVSGFFNLNLKFYSFHGDTAGAIDLIYNIFKLNEPISSLWSSNRYIIPYLQVPENFCLDSFLNQKLNYNYNLLKSHSWLISYPISYFLYLGISPKTLMVLLISLSYSVTLIIALLILLRNLSIFQSILVISTIYFWPTYLAPMTGQIYFSKLFLLPAFLLIINFEKFILGLEKNFFLILLLTIFCSLIHERATFYIGLYFLFSIFYEKKLSLFKSKENIFFVIIAFFLLFYCFFYLKEISLSPHTGSYSIENMYHNIINIFFSEYYRSHTIKMFVIIMPILFLSFFNFKFFLLSLIFLAPNILTSIGGIEKIGISVHYFSFFLPFAVYGIVTGSIKAISKKKMIAYFLPYILMHNFFINPYDLNIYFQYETNKHLNLTLNKYLTKTPNENEIMQFMDKAIKIIDNDKSISMLEEHTPYFAGKGYNKISFFPIGLSQSDYLITSYQFAKIKDGELIYNTFIKDNFKVEKGRNCIKNSIKKNYKKVLESKEISKFQYILYEKK